MSGEEERGYLLLEAMVLSALLLVMLSCAFYWQQAAKRMDRDGCETAAVYLVEGTLSEMENDVLEGNMTPYVTDVVQNHMSYHIEGRGEPFSERLYKLKAAASWEEEGTSHAYTGERMVWVHGAR